MNRWSKPSLTMRERHDLEATQNAMVRDLDRKRGGAGMRERSGAAMNDAIERLFLAIHAAQDARLDAPRTTKLLRAGRLKIAKKLAEEAVEAGHALIVDDIEEVIRESADVLYHLAALWVSAGIGPSDVYAEMARRETMLGIAEKLPKQDE